MTNPLQTILAAIRTKDYAVATESIAQVMQRKVEVCLAQERRVVGQTLVREANDVKGPLGCDAKHKSGAVCRLAGEHKGKHQATAGEAHYIWEESKSFSVKCLECGRKFKTSKMVPECPECGGGDIDIAEAFPSNGMKRHVCKSCGAPWHGPVDDAECPKCGRPEWLGKQEDYNPAQQGINAARLDASILAAQKRGDAKTAMELISRRDRLSENESFDTDYPNRKDQRAPYYKSGEKAVRSDRPGGDPDSWEAQNRQHSTRKREASSDSTRDE